MTNEGAREALLAIARQPDSEIDLARACLWIAAEDRPEIAVDAYCDRLDALANAARDAVAPAMHLLARVEALNHFLFEREGFRGNRDAYYDPRNSHLDQVIERRLGIPITLSILWIGIARRVGIDARGVGFPGHFLVRAGDDPLLIVDAFEGRSVTLDDCRARLREMAGPEARFSPALLAPTPSHEILARVLRNLKQIHIQARDFEAAVACSERIVAIQPHNVGELRDRGLLYRALDCWLPALQDLEAYLEESPTTPADATALEPILGELRARIRRLH